MSAKKRKIEDENRIFNSLWENEYLFIITYKGPLVGWSPGALHSNNNGSIYNFVVYYIDGRPMCKQGQMFYIIIL